jgi:hypothetical protein
MSQNSSYTLRKETPMKMPKVPPIVPSLSENVALTSFVRIVAYPGPKFTLFLIQNHHLIIYNVLVGVERANFFVCQYI